MFKKLVEFSERPLKTNDVVGGKYFIVNMIGKGSYGLTYLVKDKNGQSFVLKQLRKYKMLDETGKNAFKREAEVLKSFNYRGFPTLFDQFEDRNRQFIVMEYKRGRTYEELIFHDNHSFSELEAVHQLNDLLQLVKVIHEQGFVHRDLRIPNILKDKSDYYIIDFGLCRKITEKNNSEEIGNDLEKKFYREIAYKSDFYALGHFLLFLLYSTYEPLSKKKQGWEVELSISPLTKRILRKMLQLDQAYDDVNLLINDVRDCIREEQKNVIF